MKLYSPIKWLLTFLVAFTITVSTITITVAQNKVTAPQVIAALEETFGITLGQRRNHIKGVCAIGEFIGDPKAQKYSRSPLFSGQAIPVVARFSLAGGNPKVPDTAKSGRGLAAQFKLPDGSLHSIAFLNTPVFGAANPETFLAFIQSIKPDPATGKPDPEKVKAFKAKYSDNKAQADFLAQNNPPASFANSAYFGIHTFKLVQELRIVKNEMMC
jgi:catalase